MNISVGCRQFACSAFMYSPFFGKGSESLIHMASVEVKNDTSAHGARPSDISYRRRRFAVSSSRDHRN
jgi:hypothetical protein